MYGYLKFVPTKYWPFFFFFCMSTVAGVHEKLTKLSTFTLHNFYWVKGIIKFCKLTGNRHTVLDTKITMKKT